MALRYLIASGDVADPTKWDGGVSVPGTGDDCYANGFTGTISANFTVNSLNTTASGPAAAGGGFTCAAAVAITCAAGYHAGTTDALTVTALASVYGTSYGSSTTAGRAGVNLNGSSVHYGDSYGGGSSNAYGTFLQTCCFQYGDAYAGSGGNAHGTNVVSSSVLIGDSFAGSTANVRGANVTQGGCHIGDSHGGSAIGAHGTQCSAGGVHYGRCYGGTNAQAYGTSISAGGICIPTQIIDSTGFGLTVANEGIVILQGTATLAQVNITAAAGRYRIDRGVSSVRPFIRPPIYPAYAS